MAAEDDRSTAGPDTTLEHLIDAADGASDAELEAGVRSLHPADIAELVNGVERFETKQKIFRLLQPTIAAQVFTLIAAPERERIVQESSDDDLRQILEELDSDDAADLVAAVAKDRAQSLLARLPAPESARIQQLLKYSPDTAGGLMQTEYAAVLEGATIEDAVDIVRTLAEAAVSNIHNVFVVNDQFHLTGVLALPQLILARASETVDAVMDRQVTSVTVDTDQEEVAQLFKKYDLLSLPVTDPRGALLGRITIDDIVDVLEREAGEDLSKLAGLGEEEPIFDSPGRTIRRRLPWLSLNLVTTSVSASVIGLFHNTIESMAVAAAMMTIVAAQGGNAGVQTLTVMVRGLALGQVTLAHARRVVVKELAVACGNGLALGAVAAVSGLVLHRDPLLAAVLGLALLVNYIVAALVASFIPMTLHWLRADPAVASSVFVTACTDLCGFFTFLGLLTIALRYFG